MILIDLQKAFDTITVEVANQVSKFANVSFDAPQDPILAPLLF